MAGENGHIGLNLAVIGVITAVAGTTMAAVATPLAVWAGGIVFALLWLTGALALSDGASRGFLSGTLRKSTYMQIYTTLTKRLVTRLWARLCDPAEDRAGVVALLRAALTWRLYDAALLIAVAYPIVLPVGQWIVTGAEGRIGDFVLLEAAPFWWDRAAMVAVLVILALCVVARRLAVASQYPALRQVANWVPSGAVAGVLALAVAFAGAVAIAGALGIALAGAVAVALVVEYLDNLDRPRTARWVVTLAVSGGAVIAITQLDFPGIPQDLRAIFVFLAVLPLLNGLFDTASYAVTLALIRRGLRSAWPFLWGLLDLAVACILFLALGMTLVVVIHGLNLLAGASLVDLPALFAGVHDDPWAYTWLYLMLFSTVLPTVAHAGVSLLGVQGIWPLAWRRPVAAWIGDATASPLKALRASLALGVIWTLPLVVVGGVVWVLWQLGGDVVPWLLAGYFDALLWLAALPVGAM